MSSLYRKERFHGLYVGLFGRGCFDFLNCLLSGRLKFNTGLLSARFHAEGLIWVAYLLKPKLGSA